MEVPCNTFVRRSHRLCQMRRAPIRGRRTPSPGRPSLLERGLASVSSPPGVNAGKPELGPRRLVGRTDRHRRLLRRSGMGRPEFNLCTSVIPAGSSHGPIRPGSGASEEPGGIRNDPLSLAGRSMPVPPCLGRSPPWVRRRANPCSSGAYRTCAPYSPLIPDLRGYRASW